MYILISAVDPMYSNTMKRAFDFRFCLYGPKLNILGHMLGWMDRNSLNSAVDLIKILTVLFKTPIFHFLYTVLIKMAMLKSPVFATIFPKRIWWGTDVFMPFRKVLARGQPLEIWLVAKRSNVECQWLAEGGHMTRKWKRENYSIFFGRDF